MTETNSNNVNEFEDIQKKFSGSPYIEIASVKGSPPDGYEIVYRVKGVSRLDGSRAVIVDTHRVSISLPFGYPHFPPNCKPLSPVFHPDFDPDAICIGEFWNFSHSLADLIVHIGRLITFQAYSVEDVFNPEALAWAKANGDLLPLDSADLNLQIPEPISASGDGRDSEDGFLPSSAFPEGQPQDVTPPIEPEEKELKAESAAEQKGEKRRAKPESRKALMAVIAVCALFFVAACLVVVFDIVNFSGAERKWSQVTDLVDQKKFTDADMQVKEIQDLLAKVFILKKEEKLALLQEINELVDSEEYQQGIQGKILVNGIYIPAQQHFDVLDVLDMLRWAEELAKDENWKKAGELYSQAVEKTEALGEFAPVSLSKVKELARKNLAYEKVAEGNLLRSQQMWEEARDNYMEALKIISEMDGDDEAVKMIGEIRTSIDEMAFYLAVERGNGFLADKNWLQGWENYESALQLTEKLSGDASEDAKRLQGQLAIAGFNSYYEEGLKDFAEGKWDGAIVSLNRSKKLLAAAQEAGAARSITKKSITEKIVTATIKLAEVAVEACLREEKYIEAIKLLKLEIGAIERSRVSTESEFAAAAQSAAARIKKYEFLHDIQQKIVYLKGSYETIFRQFFPSIAHSKLSDPEATFLSRDGNLLLFKLQCLEENHSQQFTLEMNYQYDIRSGRWTPQKIGGGH